MPTGVIGIFLWFNFCGYTRALGSIQPLTGMSKTCTIVQALWLSTDCTAQRGSRGRALLFHHQWHYKGVRGQRHAPAALYPRKRPGTHCIGDRVSPRAGLDRWGKSRPHQDLIPGPSSPKPVAIPTELSRPITGMSIRNNYWVVKAVGV
jgi:hypothetical protein